MIKFTQIPCSELIEILPKIKMQIKQGSKRIAISRNAEVIGFLVPLKDIQSIPKELIESEKVSFKYFQQILRLWVKTNLRCDQFFYLTFHNRIVVVFVPIQFTAYLPIPTSDVSYKLLNTLL